MKFNIYHPPPPRQRYLWLFVWLLSAVGASAQVTKAFGPLTITITGPDEVCPGETVTYTAKSDIPGGFSWGRVENGSWVQPNLSNCWFDQTSSSYSPTWGTIDGESYVYAEFRSLFQGCERYEVRIDVDYKYYGPGQPRDATGGLAVCPGKWTLLSAPAATTASIDNCFYHDYFRWYLPDGWEADDPNYLFDPEEGRFYYEADGTLIVKAPNNALPGYTGNHSIMVKTAPLSVTVNLPVVSETRQVWVGPPGMPFLEDYPTTFCPYDVTSAQNLCISPEPGASRYRFELTKGNGQVINYGWTTQPCRLVSSLSLSVGNNTMRIYADNVCGTSSPMVVNLRRLSESCPGGGPGNPGDPGDPPGGGCPPGQYCPLRGVSLYPSPAKGTLHLDMEGAHFAMAAEGGQMQDEYTLQLYDTFGQLRLERHSAQLSSQLSVAALPAGLYHALLTWRGQTHRQTLRIER